MHSASFEGGLNTIERVIALGSGAVTTGTHTIGNLPKRGRISRIRYKGRSAVTGTSLTADAHVRMVSGAGPTMSLQAAPTDIEFATSLAALAGVVATFNADQSRRDALDGQIIEVIITASAVTAGPGDLLVEIDFEPR